MPASEWRGVASALRWKLAGCAGEEVLKLVDDPLEGSVRMLCARKDDRSLDCGDRHRRERPGALVGDARTPQDLGVHVLPATEDLARRALRAGSAVALERRGKHRTAGRE